jgi:hypothetical protein
MSRISIALKFEAATHANEGAQVFAKDNAWLSTAGGWLPNSGSWTQGADGLRLKAADGKVHAFCEGLNFAICKESDRGNAHYLQIGDAGKWEVVATNP